jgi:hypothetical protein
MTLKIGTELAVIKKRLVELSRRLVSDAKFGNRLCLENESLREEIVRLRAIVRQDAETIAS